MKLYNINLSQKDLDLYLETQRKLNNSTNDYDSNMYQMQLEEIREYYYRCSMSQKTKNHNYMNLLEA